MASMQMFAVLIQLLISCSLYSVFLRGAIWLFNRTFAKSGTLAPRPREAQSAEPEFQVTEAGPYTAPATYSDAFDMRPASLVPEPSLLKGMGIGALTLIVQAIMSVVLIRFAGLMSVGMILSAVFGFCMLAIILKFTLPTTFLRGFAVTAILWFCVFVLVLILVIPFRLLSAT